MNELRQATRLLLRHAGFTLTAVLTLGLGIGLVATQYSLIDGVLLRPLPYADADRIYHVARAVDGAQGAWAPLAIDEFAAQREQQASFERLAAFRSETYNLVIADFNTYFVGESGILVHDNTARRPTQAVVPGLTAK